MSDESEGISQTLSIWNAISPWLGPAVVASIINVGYSLLSKRSDRKDNENKINNDKLSDLISPILDSSEEVIGRFNDIIKYKRTLDLNDSNKIKNQIDDFDISARNDELTTIYRIMRLFAAIVYFEQNRDMLSSTRRINNCEFYLLAKIKMALKSNLSDADKKIQSESMEYIGQKMLTLNEQKNPRWINFYDFITKAKTDPEFLKLIDAIRNWFNVDWNSDPNKQTIAVSLFFIYLIDFYHDMGTKRRWDTIRLHFINITYWFFHTGSQRIPYLYQQDDLDSTDYFMTFNTIYSDRFRELSRNKRLEKSVKRSKRIEYKDHNTLISKVKNEQSVMKYIQNPTESLDQLRKMK